MLPLERTVVTAMLTTTDPTQQREVVEFVGSRLTAMPAHLRAGMAGISVALATWSGARRLIGAGRSPSDVVSWLDDHPLGLVRQWVRALRSLVLFAEQEKLEAALA